METQEIARLSVPAPRREWVQQDNGTWFTRPWGLEAVLECKRGGGWFSTLGQHCFLDQHVATVALRNEGWEGVVAARKARKEKAKGIVVPTAEELLADLWGFAV